MPSIDYTPNAAFFGIDSLGYRVTNVDGGTDTGNVTVIVADTEDPIATITSPTAGQTLALGTTSIAVSGTSSDNDSVQLVQARLNGGAWLATTGSTSWSIAFSGLTDGSSYTVEVRAHDPAGNISNVVARSFSVLGDGTNPTVTITDPTGELAANTASYVVQGTAADDGTVTVVRWRVDGGAFQTASGTTSWSANVVGLVNGGSVNFEVQAEDAGGNLSSIAQRTLTVNAPPIANDDSIGTTMGNGLIIDVLANDTAVDAGATLSITVPPANGTATVVA